MADAFRSADTYSNEEPPSAPEAGPGIVVHISSDREPKAPKLKNGVLTQELPGGALLIDFSGGKSKKKVGKAEHDANLAEYLDVTELNKIGSDLLDGINADLESRKEWITRRANGLKHLALKMESPRSPSADADTAVEGQSTVRWPGMLDAVLRFQANARGEMLPAAGPVRTDVIADDASDMEMLAQRKQTFLNYYLTEVAEEYYPDFDQMLFWLPLQGSTFKKVYKDPLRRRPVAPFILPDKLIMSYTATDLSAAQRVTHEQIISRADMVRMKLSGAYRDVQLGEPEPDSLNAVQGQRDRSQGRTPEYDDDETPYTVLECHTCLDIPIPELQHTKPGESPDDEPMATGLPLPYIVTIDRDSQQILAIRRNWVQGSPDFERDEFFVQYQFIPGIGSYGLGYAHILGGTARALTMLMRQQIDATTLSLFPAGFRVKGMRLDSNFVPLEPTEFREIDTGGLPIQDAIMPLPFQPPTAAHAAVMGALLQAAQRVSATTDTNIGDGRQDAPVGTTLALQELATRMETGILKRLHVAHRKELRLLSKLFAEDPTAVYPYRVNGVRGQAVASDFVDATDVVPVSDPNIPSQTQRIVQGQAQIQLAQSQPGIYDMRELNANIQRVIGTPDAVIAKILPAAAKAQPLDPSGELAALQQKKTVAAFEGQDHQAHIAALMAVAQNPTMQALVQQIQAGLSDLVGQHIVLQARAQIQAQGVQLPPIGQPMPPAIATQIAQAIAKVWGAVSQQAQAQAQAQQQQAQGAGQPGNDPALDQVAAADVQRKAQADQADHQIEMAKLALQEKQMMLDAQIKREQMEIDARTKIKIAADENLSRERIAAGGMMVDTLGPQASPEARLKAEADRRADQTKRDIAADASTTKIVTALIAQSAKTSDLAQTEAQQVQANPPPHLQGDQPQGAGVVPQVPPRPTA